MEEHGDNAEPPHGAHGRADGPEEEGGEHEGEGDTALGGPLEPVAVGLVGEGAEIDDGVADRKSVV